MVLLYVLAAWIHLLTVCLWIGAMFFGDPNSTRFFSRLFERKLKGIGWYAQAVLWFTGIFMLHYRGITLEEMFSADFVASTWGRLYPGRLRRGRRRRAPGQAHHLGGAPR